MYTQLQKVVFVLVQSTCTCVHYIMIKSNEPQNFVLVRNFYHLRYLVLNEQSQLATQQHIYYLPLAK